jgi:hypothetical protein
VEGDGDLRFSGESDRMIWGLGSDGWVVESRRFCDIILWVGLSSIMG